MSGDNLSHPQPAHRAMGQSNRRRKAWAGAVILSLVAASTVTVGTAATAAGPVLTADIAATGASVASGGRAAYEITVECSDLAADGCLTPVLTMAAPQGRDSKGGIVTATAPLYDSPDVVSAKLARGVWTVKMRDMKPGTSVAFGASWGVPNYTTLPGTVLATNVDLSFTNVKGTVKKGAVSQPKTYATTAKPSLFAGKYMLSPITEDRVKADSVASYRLVACVPNGAEGQLTGSTVKIVDTFDSFVAPAGTPGISVRDTNGAVVADGARTRNGGVVDMTARTVTWTVPVTAVPLCGTNAVIERDISIYYPASMVPATGAAVPTYTFDNEIAATMTFIDGSTKTETAAVHHSVTTVPPTAPGKLGIWPENQPGYQMDPTSRSVAHDDIETPYAWRASGRWGQRDVVNNDQTRNVVITNAMPCIENGQAASRYASNGAYGMGQQPFANNGDLAALTEPVCTTPGVRTVKLEFAEDKTVSAAGYKDISAVAVRFVRPNGTAGTALKTYTAAAPLKSRNLLIYGTAGDTFNLNPASIVTEVRVIMRDVRAMVIDDTIAMALKDVPWFKVWGTNTPAFAAARDAKGAPLEVQTDTIGAAMSEPTNAVRGIPAGDGTKLAINGERYYAAYRFMDKTADFSIAKTAVTPVTAVKPGDTITWQLAPTIGRLSAPVTPNVVDVLPVGLEYVPGSSTWTAPGVGEPKKDTVTINNVVRTRLTWTFTTPLAAGKSATGTFQTRVTLKAASGAHSSVDTQQTAAMFDADGALNSGLNETDVNDLDNDGDTTERVAISRLSWTVSTQSGVAVEKLVRGSQDKTWSTDGVSAATVDDSGTFVDYRLRAQNTGTSVLTDTVLYDVLPHIGDTAIGADLRGESRRSQFPVTFRELTTVPAGVAVEYSTSENPCRPELFPRGNQGACDDDWTSTPPTATSVQALKFTIAKLSPNATRVIEFRGDVEKYVFSAGADQTCYADPAKKAFNNVAVQTNRVQGAVTSALLPAEAPVVSIRSLCGRVGDYVWYDDNSDGVQDPNEKPAPGIVVQLLDGDGNPVLDDHGKVITATTDKNGLYSFTVPLGTWSMKPIKVPAGYVATLPAPVTLTSTHTEDLRLDAGLAKPVSKISIEKRDIDGNDADTKADSASLPTGATTLVFTVRNPGTEPQANITVADEVLTGNARVTDLVCEFPDGSRGTSWAGPFAVGASFQCTAALSGVGVGESHSNAATVTAKGETSGKPATDIDLYHAHRLPPLASTGADGAGTLALGGLAVLVMVAGVVLMRVRRNVAPTE